MVGVGCWADGGDIENVGNCVHQISDDRIIRRSQKERKAMGQFIGERWGIWIF